VPAADRGVEFKNVWNRRGLFLHASFVSNSAVGYLGRDGEFYTEPSKMYPVENPAPTFSIETSIDGYNRIALPYVNWIVELSFILDADEYQGA
jgi:hypothetical protein